MAVAADPEPGSLAVLVVCDGVSTSPDSDIASLAAARRARDVLVALQPAGLGPTSRAAAIARAMVNAVAQADEAVLAATPDEGANAAACTFAAAVVEGDLVVFGNVGDSRVYWLPDPGGSGAGAEAAELSLDDSMAQARIAMGVDRVTAENGPQAHAITKWLGRDSPDIVPRTGSVGWVSRGGCSCAPTGCGTTAPRPLRWASWSARSPGRPRRRSSWARRWCAGPTSRAGATTSRWPSPGTEDA